MEETEDKSAHSIDEHRRRLDVLCRVCGERVLRHTKDKGRNAVLCAKYAAELSLCFDIDVSRDEEGKHPPCICVKCYRKLLRAKRSQSKATNKDVPLDIERMSKVWTTFDPDLSFIQCSSCKYFQTTRLGGRPKKRPAPVKRSAQQSFEEQSDLNLSTGDSLSTSLFQSTSTPAKRPPPPRSVPQTESCGNLAADGKWPTTEDSSLSTMLCQSAVSAATELSGTLEHTQTSLQLTAIGTAPTAPTEHTQTSLALASIGIATNRGVVALSNLTQLKDLSRDEVVSPFTPLKVKSKISVNVSDDDDDDSHNANLDLPLTEDDEKLLTSLVHRKLRQSSDKVTAGQRTSSHTDPHQTFIMPAKSLRTSHTQTYPERGRRTRTVHSQTCTAPRRDAAVSPFRQLTDRTFFFDSESDDENLDKPFTEAEEKCLTWLVRRKLQNSNDKITVRCKKGCHPIVQQRVKQSNNKKDQLEEKGRAEEGEIRAKKKQKLLQGGGDTVATENESSGRKKKSGNGKRSRKRQQSSGVSPAQQRVPPPPTVLPSPREDDRWRQWMMNCGLPDPLDTATLSHPHTQPPYFSPPNNTHPSHFSPPNNTQPPHFSPLESRKQPTTDPVSSSHQLSAPNNTQPPQFSPPESRKRPTIDPAVSSSHHLSPPESRKRPTTDPAVSSSHHLSPPESRKRPTTDPAVSSSHCKNKKKSRPAAKSRTPKQPPRENLMPGDTLQPAQTYAGTTDDRPHHHLPHHHLPPPPHYHHHHHHHRDQDYHLHRHHTSEMEVEMQSAADVAHGEMNSVREMTPHDTSVSWPVLRKMLQAESAPAASAVVKTEPDNTESCTCHSETDCTNTLPNYTHADNTHTLPNYTHTLPNYTHTDNTHTLPNYTHTDSTHTLPANTQTATLSTLVKTESWDTVVQPQENSSGPVDTHTKVLPQYDSCGPPEMMAHLQEKGCVSQDTSANLQNSCISPDTKLICQDMSILNGIKIEPRDVVTQPEENSSFPLDAKGLPENNSYGPVEFKVQFEEDSSVSPDSSIHLQGNSFRLQEIMVHHPKDNSFGMRNLKLQPLESSCGPLETGVHPKDHSSELRHLKLQPLESSCGPLETGVHLQENICESEDLDKVLSQERLSRPDIIKVYLQDDRSVPLEIMVHSQEDSREQRNVAIHSQENIAEPHDTEDHVQENSCEPRDSRVQAEESRCEQSDVEVYVQDNSCFPSQARAHPQNRSCGLMDIKTEPQNPINSEPQNPTVGHKPQNINTEPSNQWHSS